MDYKSISVGMLLFGMLFFWLAAGFTKQSFYGIKGFKEILQLSLIGAIGLGMTTLFLNKSLEWLDASLAIVLLFQFTWIVVLIDYLMTRKKPEKWKWLAILLILTGTVFSVGLISTAPREITLTGMVFGLLSGVSYAVFLYFIGTVAPRASALAKSTVMSTSAFILIGITSIGSVGAVADWETLLFWSVVIGVFGPVLPTILFSKGTPLIGGPLTGMLGAIELPVTLMVSAVLLGEIVGGSQWFGILLILLGIVVSERE